MEKTYYAWEQEREEEDNVYMLSATKQPKSVTLVADGYELFAKLSVEVEETDEPYSRKPGLSVGDLVAPMVGDLKLRIKKITMIK